MLHVVLFVIAVAGVAFGLAPEVASASQTENLTETTNNDAGKTETANQHISSYPSYDAFRDDITKAIRNAKQRVLVVTTFLSDGDVATALFGASLRRCTVGIILNRHNHAHWRSRYSYLVQAKLPVFIAPLSAQKMGGQTTLVIDDQVWRISAAIDDKHRGSVLYVPSPWTAPEVMKWFSGLTRATQIPPRPMAGAKTPTSTKKTQNRSAIIETGASTAIPRYLPRKTRLQRILSGEIESEALLPMEPTMDPAAGIEAPEDRLETELQSQTSP